MFSYLYYILLSYLTDLSIDPAIANFGIYHRCVMDSLRQFDERSRFFPLMIQWVGYDTVAINVVHSKRTGSNSSYNFRKLFSLAVNMMITFSNKPLRILIRIGFFISSISLIFAFYILVQALLGNYKEGWPSLIISTWFLSGLIIMALGVLGFYVSKTFEETKRRPLYVVKEKTGEKE